jgi:hypothetical protein
MWERLFLVTGRVFRCQVSGVRCQKTDDRVQKTDFRSRVGLCADRICGSESAGTEARPTSDVRSPET